MAMSRRIIILATLAAVGTGAGAMLVRATKEEPDASARAAEQGFRDYVSWMMNGATPAEHSAATRNAKENIPFVREFHEIYPDATSFVTAFAANRRDVTSWNSQAMLYGRYILTLKFPIEFDDDRRQVAFYGDPVFYLEEAIKIEDLPDGRISIHFGEGWEFGSEKWRELVQAKGKLEHVFEGIRANAPVAGFEQYRKQKLEAAPDTDGL